MCMQSAFRLTNKRANGSSKKTNCIPLRFIQSLFVSSVSLPLSISPSLLVYVGYLFVWIKNTNKHELIVYQFYSFFFNSLGACRQLTFVQCTSELKLCIFSNFTVLNTIRLLLRTCSNVDIIPYTEGEKLFCFHLVSIGCSAQTKQIVENERKSI